MEATSAASSTSSVDGRSVSGGGSDYLNLGMFSSSGSTQQQQPQQQQSGDLLVGAAGSAPFSSLGNGFGNDSSGATASGTLDLNDFPSLGGTGAAASGNTLAAAIRQQQQQQQLLVHQQQILQGTGGSKNSNLYRLAMTGTNGNFTMANEDFPALSGAPPGANGPANGGSNVLGSSTLLSGTANTASISRSSSSGASGLYGNELDTGSSQLEGVGLLGGTGLGGLGGLRGLQQSSTTPNTSLSRGPSGSAGAIGSSSGSGGGGQSGSVAGSALNGDYGLLGLLGVIRMTDADRNALALGSDLTLMGLNLGSTEQIYSTFSGPWSDNQASKDPHYQLPACYYMQPPALKTGHLSKFQLETLFYIFYALPKDVLQAYAAQELYTREWRYHSELKLWFKRAGPSDGVANPSTGSPQYIYFDINSWERRLFNGSMNQNITNGFLPEEEVRVKFPNS